MDDTILLMIIAWALTLAACGILLGLYLHLLWWHNRLKDTLEMITGEADEWHTIILPFQLIPRLSLHSAEGQPQNFHVIPPEPMIDPPNPLLYTKTLPGTPADTIRITWPPVMIIGGGSDSLTSFIDFWNSLIPELQITDLNDTCLKHVWQ